VLCKSGDICTYIKGIASNNINNNDKISHDSQAE
jgi:hypothetical protein